MPFFTLPAYTARKYDRALCDDNRQKHYGPVSDLSHCILHAPAPRLWPAALLEPCETLEQLCRFTARPVPHVLDTPGTALQTNPPNACAMSSMLGAGRQAGIIARSRTLGVLVGPDPSSVNYSIVSLLLAVFAVHIYALNNGCHDIPTSWRRSGL